MEFSRPDYWSGWSFSSPGDLPNPEIEPRSPALWVDSLAAEPQVKPKNTGVGSLSLFQRIFPTQQSNWGLLPCRWILYQLSYWTKIDLIYVLALSLLSCVTLSKLLHLSEPPSLFREMGVSKRTYLGEKMLRSCLPGTWSRVRHVGCRQRMPGLALVY